MLHMTAKKRNKLYQMKKGKVALLILCLFVGFLSCKKDDGLVAPEIVIRDRAEQQIIDNDSILAYLETHYYNKSEFEGNTNPKIADLTITKITDEVISSDADSLLINAVETHTVAYADTDYEYYILRINQGGGEGSPNFSDTVRVIYEGFTLDDKVFDSAVTEVDFDLVGNGQTTLGLVPIWRKVIPQFETAEGFDELGDGTIAYYNHGTGVMFAPSGLGYFSNATGLIPAYSPLIFKFELYHMFVNDHDNDGIPSYLEDLNGDGEYIVNYADLTDDTDDDTDGDGTPNYVDSDDDGDGILTIYEDINKDGDPTNDDTNGNSIPNYLDRDDIESNRNN